MSHYHDVRDRVQAEEELKQLEQQYQTSVDKRDWTSCDILSEQITRKEKQIKDLK